MQFLYEKKTGAFKENPQNMLYENFSRHLREKYSTRFHFADQLVDQLKENKQARTSSRSVHELNTQNMLKAQREICFPLITHLNGIECEEQKPREDSREADPYLNECFRAAERIKNNRRSNRDRQICYENVILAQKLERIKKQAGENARDTLDKDYQNHCRLLISKANCGQQAVKAIHKRFITKQAIVSEETRSSETTETSYHSSASVENESKTLTSEHNDDQATAADMDASIEYSHSKSPVQKQRTNRTCNCTYSKNQSRLFPRENDRVYQHLNQIDMTIIKDTIPHSLKHFSVCILPHFHAEKIKPLNKRSNGQSNDRQYAFKKEILYPV